MENYQDFMNQPEIKEFCHYSSENGCLCEPKEILYHYTSTSALCSIIQNQEFWMTKSNFMNDTSEINYASDLFIERLKQSNIPDLDKENIIRKFKESKDVKLFNDCFVLSLSANCDSLPMWSYYGNNDGYNIGMSPDFICNFANSELLTEIHFIKESGTYNKVKTKCCVEITKREKVGYTMSISANYVLYDKEKQIRIFDMLLEEVSKLIQINTPDAIFQIRLFLSVLLDFIPFFKHPSYKNEEEYRLLVQIQCNGKDIRKIENYRALKGALVPYITIKLNKTSYIKSITVSPWNNSDLTKLGVDNLAKSYDLCG